MRLIDGDALVDILTKVIENVKGIARIFDVEDEEYVHDIVEVYTEVIDCIKDMPTEQQWIPCSKRLPEDVSLGEEYPTVIYCTDSGEVDAGWYEVCTKKWWQLGQDAEIYDVIAWMPLPEPYRGKT